MLARVSALACLVLSAVAMPWEGIQPPAGGGATNMSVLQLAAAIPELYTFVSAAKAANLTDVLSSSGPFTVFAPTNEAFAQLPPGRLEGLLDPTNIDELRAVLLYHTVGEAIFSKDFTDGGAVKTMEGESVDIKLHDGIQTRASGAIFIDKARVDKPDLAASNGVIHTIGGVLEPLGLNHLYFRYFTGEYNCGQVDAGPRMPISIFDKENAHALQMYIDVTLAFAWLPFYPWRHLELGTCSGAGFTDNDGVPSINPILNIPCREIRTLPTPFLPDNRTINWAPDKLMEPLYLEHCECDYHGIVPKDRCKDVPDNPLAANWCSLCGPLFNRPIEIQCFKSEEY
jgi:uncharacterized surface protein with fasciclin (FAS1) repeats